MKGRRRNSERIQQLFGISVQDEQNFVMIIVPKVRKTEVMSAISAACGTQTGAHGVVIPERRAAGMTAGAWKTSSGAAARLPVARATNMTRTLEAYQKAGLMVVGLAADGEAELGDLELLTGPVVIVAGSEGKGLSRLVSETCDMRVRIPMSGLTESLNAGVAAGIVLYEAARLRAKR